MNKDNRKKDLLDKLLKKLDRDKKLMLAYGFYKFRKNAKLDEQIENAKTIQKFCRKVLDTAIKNKIDTQKKLADLMEKLHRKKFFKT